MTEQERPPAESKQTSTVQERISSLLMLHDRLAWHGLAKIASLGLIVLLGREMWLQSNLWFPRLVDSPIALALLVCCAIIAAYAVVHDRLATRVDLSTDRVHSLMQSELAWVRNDVATLRRELADARNELHETRSLSARTYVAQGLDQKTVQTLLGHSELEMTELYLNDRGLSAHEWKRVEVAGAPA